MTEEIRIEIPGDPVAKARHRMGRFGSYTPIKTAEWEECAALIARLAMRGRKPIQGPVKLSLVAVFKVSKSWPRWKKNAALEGRFHHTKTPDIDNLAKAVMDSFNKSNAIWKDDSQVCQIDAKKQFGQNPGVYVVVTPINEEKLEAKP